MGRRVLATKRIEQQAEFNFEAAPLARHDDPQTSRDAAAAVIAKLPERRRECLELIKNNPGICGSEIEREHPQLRKRIAELANKGLIEQCGERQSRVSGYRGVCWRVSDGAAAALADEGDA